MPKRTDVEKILVVGSGPIVIGQACEFDYSGTQAVQALRREGYQVVLVNSNPASIMTDPEVAHRTYIEPLTVNSLTRILEREQPDVLLPTVGGQTALNLAVQLSDAGILKDYGVKLIGARVEAIRLAEDRRLFAGAMGAIGLEVPRGRLVGSEADALEVAAEVGYPAIVRPSFTLGGSGSGIAYNREELVQIVRLGLEASPVSEVLVEESVLGWKEFELEVMRDRADNFVVICSIENLDPMGVHTGDSVTVAPAVTLSDREYQVLRDQARQVLKRVGVETGGSNVQFAVDPQSGRVRVIEMNPRVSRSSALASKATGFPIAKIAALLAVGYTLDEIPNDITKKTPASFEPTLDYCVVKVPRFAFEKFRGAQDVLGTQMKSVGETMAIGRTFKEALQKGLRSLEVGLDGLGPRAQDVDEPDPHHLERRLAIPHSRRLLDIRDACRAGWSVARVADLSKIDPWFLHQIEEIVRREEELKGAGGLDALSRRELYDTKRLGFSDRQLAAFLGTDEGAVRARRRELGLAPVYKTVDTCGAEFPAATPYHFSTWEEENEAVRSPRRKVMILGGGPNRIGQGIEFDYCCVHAALALREEGFETIMVNNNPETVSTDYDTSDKLYFEPLTLEDVLHVVELEQPEGVIVQFGGQTPLKLALPLKEAGVPIWGTSPDDIDLAEDRERFGQLVDRLGIRCPPWGIAFDLPGARREARRIGFPLLVRPSYVLGGRAMAVVYDEEELAHYFEEAAAAAEKRAILLDRFLEDAFEADVDALADGTDVVIGGVMQHVEEAGVHSGDSACVLPSYLIPDDALAVMRRQTAELARALHVRGLLNVQFAIKDGVVYVLEVNPRASRTVPFVSKATGVPLAKLAAKVMAGRTLRELGLTTEPVPPGYSVKESVFPFKKFAGVDPLLGPEMRSTGEVMGIGDSFGIAWVKAQQAAGFSLPARGTAFLSVNDNDKPSLVPIATDLAALGFRLLASGGTADFLKGKGVPVERLFKVSEGRPNVLDLLKNGEIDIVVSTPLGRESFHDEVVLRRDCHDLGVLLLTTLSATRATIEAIRALRDSTPQPVALQDHHARAGVRS
jgi:carbamoyl-phosphate synthase large subunit